MGRTFKLREIDRQRLRKIAIMSRRIFQAARPCLRKLESPAHAQPPAGALVASKFSTSSNCEYAARAEAVKMVSDPRFPPEHLPKTKPPSARPVETRKTQMIRAYTSLLRSTPLMLFFQHNNLTAVEWTAVRRELGKAIRVVSTPSLSVDISDDIRLQVVRTNMLNVAMKIVEFHDPEAAAALETTPRTSIPGGLQNNQDRGGSTSICLWADRTTYGWSYGGSHHPSGLATTSRGGA